MQETTPTLAPESPPSEEELHPAPVEAQREEVLAPQPEVGPEAEPPKGDEESGAEEAPWWHSAKTKDELEGHEELRPLLDKAKEDGQAEAQGRLQPMVQKRRDYARQQLGAMQTIAKNADVLNSRLQRLTRESNPDREVWYDLVEEMRPTVEAFKNMANVQSQIGGAGWVVEQLCRGDGALAAEFADRVEGIGYDTDGTGSDPNFGPDFLKRLTAKDVKEAEDRAYKRGREHEKKAAGETTKAKQRTTEGPNLAPGMPTGGRSDNDLLLDPTTTHKELVAIRARQKEAGE